SGTCGVRRRLRPRWPLAVARHGGFVFSTRSATRRTFRRLSLGQRAWRHLPVDRVERIAIGRSALLPRLRALAERRLGAARHAWLAAGDFRQHGIRIAEQDSFVVTRLSTLRGGVGHFGSARTIFILGFFVRIANALLVGSGIGEFDRIE